MKKNNNMALTLQELERKVLDLEKWKKDRERQQITSPLDENSKTIILSRVIRFTDKVQTTITANKSIKVIIDGQQYQINAL
jgi:hypothetical protein